MARNKNRTRRKREFVESLGIKYIEIYECQYKHWKDNDAELNRFAHSREPVFFKRHRGSNRVTEDTIINSVMTDELFGAVLVDIHVPDALWDKFSECSLIFCTSTITWDMLSDDMKQHWRDTQIAPDGQVLPFPEKRVLVGGMRAARILLATPLLKFYLEQGLVVTKVHEVK